MVWQGKAREQSQLDVGRSNVQIEAWKDILVDAIP